MHDELGEHVLSAGEPSSTLHLLSAEACIFCAPPRAPSQPVLCGGRALVFAQMIKVTSACGGDVIKFAGDALIVLWTDGPKDVLAHRACECALELQDVLHDEPMTQSIRLSLKVHDPFTFHSTLLGTASMPRATKPGFAFWRRWVSG